MATPIITDGSTDRVRHAPRVVLPAHDVFAVRAERFAQLARGSAVADYLTLLARIAAAQQRALEARVGEGLPDAALAASRDFGMPPLSSQAHARSDAWRSDLRDLLGSARAGASEEVAGTIDRLAAAEAAALEGYADRLLAGTAPADEAAVAPFVGAALQTYFTRLAAALEIGWIENCDVSGFCPACASRPVASVVRIGGDRANLRYLVCSLCSAEWHVSRIRCTSCESEKDVKYLALQSREDARDTGPATRAEACDACMTYLKIFYQEKDPNLEPVADDLATIALDLAVDEQGYARSGPNLLFHPGTW
jgi:FdhE protein